MTFMAAFSDNFPAFMIREAKHVSGEARIMSRAKICLRQNFASKNQSPAHAPRSGS
jgi:hypothetical protein